MKKKVILKLFSNISDSCDRHGFLCGASNEALRDYEDYSQLFENVRIDRNNCVITTEKCIIHYIGGVLDDPLKILGFRADEVYIYDNFLNEDFMGSFIYPIVNDDNTKIKFK